MAEGLDLFLLHNAESVFFIDDDESELLEAQSLVQQRLGTD